MPALVPADSVVRRVAHLKACGHPWQAVAEKVDLPAAAIELLPSDAPEAWADAFAAGLSVVQAEAFAVCLKMLIDRMRGSDPKAGMAAAELLVKVHTAGLRHRGKGKPTAGEPAPAASLGEPSSGRASLPASQSNDTTQDRSSAPETKEGDGELGNGGVGDGVRRGVVTAVLLLIGVLAGGWAVAAEYRARTAGILPSGGRQPLRSRNSGG